MPTRWAKKAEVIQAIRPFEPGRRWKDVVRGQYGAGTVADRAAQAYRSEPDVAADSIPRHMSPAS